MRIGVFFVFIIALIGPVTALGQVAISTVDRELQPGVVVTITGSGFGVKSSATPWMWDDLGSPAYSGLNDGDPIPTRDGDNGHPQDSNAPHKDADSSISFASTCYETSPGSVRVPGRPVYSATGSSGWLMEIGRPSNEYLYLDWWIHSTNINSNRDSAELLNKILRIWVGPTSAHHEDGHISMLPKKTTYDIGPTSDDKVSVYPWVYPEEGEWTHIAVWTDASGGLTADGNSKGVLKIWRNGELRTSANNLGYREAPLSGTQEGFTWVEVLGMQAYSGTTLLGGENYWGDIYIDNTQARVVLGDSSTWQNVSHYEMQIPQNWASSQIEFIANLGSFTSEDNIYLYVVDANGNVNSNGFQVAGDLPDPNQMPGQPGQPQHNN